jgi:hypothetical protein
MNYALSYLGRSGIDRAGALRFAPNLARPKVAFDGEVAHPVRFREAMSALHDVVVGDLRRPKRDRTQYFAWLDEQRRNETNRLVELQDEIRRRELARIAAEPVPPDLDSQFRRMHRQYWDARRKWANELSRNDPEMFRHLVPCDPVVTVADDAVFFECFSKDESSYGCLFVDRGAFRDVKAASPGTTNVDYSLALYEHFQTLRSYRPTRLLVDPTGFEVQVSGREDHREEKIDLPPSWLRGFGQLQAALGLPARTVELPVESVYSILAWLKRHREAGGPRSLRFQLTPGRPPVIVIEPWGVPVASRGASYRGGEPEEIKVWGRRRLTALARLLPIATRIEVKLLGSGLPSVWIAHLGDMRFVLALSGWTANDWAGGASLELLAATTRADSSITETLRRDLPHKQRASLASLMKATGASRDVLSASLHRLAKEGQVVYDFAADCYRWREVMPVALSAEVIGPPPPEVAAAPGLVGKVVVARREAVGARLLLVAKVDGTSCEALLAGDGRFAKAKCSCKFFFKSRLRAGPCRHLLALQMSSVLS